MHYTKGESETKVHHKAGISDSIQEACQILEYLPVVAKISNNKAMVFERNLLAYFLDIA